MSASYSVGKNSDYIESKKLVKRKKNANLPLMVGWLNCFMIIYYSCTQRTE